MMRFPIHRSPYNRRLRKSRRGIVVATVLTLAAFVLTIAAMYNGSHMGDEVKPVAVQTPESN
ncbi:MAG: hypothetical protein KDJ47_14060 [Hyphomicrobiaceae bacterium]|nr:hypothetical protein [Hyphomicrobiaceae bacterium]